MRLVNVGRDFVKHIGGARSESGDGANDGEEHAGADHRIFNGGRGALISQETPPVISHRPVPLRQRCPE